MVPSRAHEIAVTTVSEDPSILRLLVEKLHGKPFVGPLEVVDSTVRLAGVEEVRSDLILLHAAANRCHAFEVQLGVDRQKGRRWAVLASLLLNRRGEMGDLLVLTPDRGVAKWAPGACNYVGPRGTRLKAVPVLLYVGRTQIPKLLDERCPKLAFFAAWAMYKRRGKRAYDVVKEALRITERLPEPLRSTQKWAIMNVLDERLFHKLNKTEITMDLSAFSKRVPNPNPLVVEWVRQLEARGLTFNDGVDQIFRHAELQERRKREALLALLLILGFDVSESDKARIHKASESMLDRWIAQAAKATTVAEALAEPQRRRPKRSPACSTVCQLVRPIDPLTPAGDIHSCA